MRKETSGLPLFYLTWSSLAYRLYIAIIWIDYIDIYNNNDNDNNSNNKNKSGWRRTSFQGFTV